MNPDTMNPVLATTASPILKPTYQFISTQDILGSLEKTGWYPVETKFAKPRKASNQGFQRHIVQLHNDDFMSIPGLAINNQSRPQIALMGSHDGSTALRGFLGFLRTACLNGVLAGTGLRSFRTIHSGNGLADKVAEGIQYMTEGLPQLIESVQRLQAGRFTPEARETLVRTLVDERLAKNHVLAGSVKYDAVLDPRRDQDKEEDAFTVFNRVQEAIIRGGIQYQSVTQQLDNTGKVVAEEIRNRTTRKLNSIPQAVRLNTLAYDLAVSLVA